jgi:hypothetical protein
MASSPGVTAIQNGPGQQRRGENAGSIRDKVARVKIAAEHEVANRRPTESVDPWRAIELTELDSPTERERQNRASLKWRLRRDDRHPPEDHGAPKRVAENIAQTRRQPRAAPMHSEAQHDRADRQRGVPRSRAYRPSKSIRSSIRSAVTLG